MNETQILSQVLDRIRPDQTEQQNMQELANNILSRIGNAASRLGLSGVEGILVGSAARGTWISGEHDLDIFISFPEDTPDLKTVGLDISRLVASDADNYEERYAEHPYIHAYYGDFEVDLVPCYRVESAACIKSAVDRTPFHNQFIVSRIRGLEDQVLLLKQFMKGAGVYGSDLRTGGFSGYLAELLIIHNGSFQRVLESANTWRPGTIIDIMGHGNKQHREPLVVVDPTDPARNVAAALTLDRFARFIHSARQYLRSPTLEMFFPEPAAAINDEEFDQILHERQTTLLALVFDKPDVVDDILYPQLFMLHRSVRDLLLRHDFPVLGGDIWAGEGEAAVVLEMLTCRLPIVKKHMGPPVWARPHAEEFEKKYSSHHGLSGLYIENGRYVIDIPRKYPDATDLLIHEIKNCRLGKHVGVSIRSGFRVLQDRELLAIDHESFRKFLSGLFHLDSIVIQ